MLGAIKGGQIMFGDSTYTWDNLLPYFQRSVKLNVPNAQARPSNATVELDINSISTSSGLVQVLHPNYVNSVSSYFAAALDQIRSEQIPGLLSGNILGW